MKTLQTTIIALLLTVTVRADDFISASLALARDLHNDGLHSLSALEFRRCSYNESSSEAEKSGLLAAAAWEYWLDTDLTLTLKMLDNAEEVSGAAGNFSLLLRGEIARRQKSYPESDFYLNTLESSSAPTPYKVVATSRKALLSLDQKDHVETRRLLKEIDAKSSLSALSELEASRGRSPRLGGILGMIPGLGYTYSGEYANGLRSLILNGIFIYAMAETGSRDQWGAFTALSFFELTWYTGSIYGGIDAAHRFNKRREDAVANAILEEYSYELDLEAVPSITVEFSF